MPWHDWLNVSPAVSYQGLQMVALYCFYRSLVMNARYRMAGPKYPVN